MSCLCVICEPQRCLEVNGNLQGLRAESVFEVVRKLMTMIRIFYSFSDSPGLPFYVG